MASSIAEKPATSQLYLARSYIELFGGPDLDLGKARGGSMPRHATNEQRSLWPKMGLPEGAVRFWLAPSLFVAYMPRHARSSRLGASQNRTAKKLNI